MDNLGKIGRSLMDNCGGKLGSSLIFYFMAIDDRRTMPKHILAWGTVPQRVINKKIIPNI